MPPRGAPAVLLALAAAPLTPVHAAVPPPAATELVGVYQQMFLDVVQRDGSLRDIASDLLEAGGRTFRLSLPKGRTLKGGSSIRVRGSVSGRHITADSVEVTAPPAAPARTATRSATVTPTVPQPRTLVILAYWTAPDSMTPSRASSQIFGDDHAWFREASYGQVGVTGRVAPSWVRIAAPTGGLCVSYGDEIMSRARAAARANHGALYDHTTYDRTIVYFPRCAAAEAKGTAGWAYRPGTQIWLNGYLDRRVTVHELGHSLGLAHAGGYNCRSGTSRTTMTGTCTVDQYADQHDAMGAGAAVAHFSGPMKDQLGWLTSRKRIVGGPRTTFTLPPFEKPSSTPVVAVVGSTTSATRFYYLEYRQPVGFDGRLPVGATAGVTVRLRDLALSRGTALLDHSLSNGWQDVVLRSGRSWTSPDGVRIAVGAVTASGASVTVEGGRAPPTQPSAPTSVTAVALDGAIRVTWAEPTSNGRTAITGYVVSRVGTTAATTVASTARSAEVTGLTNGTAYTVTVRAKNAAGLSPAAGATATPQPLTPTVSFSAPANRAAIQGGRTSLAATPVPNARTKTPISHVEYTVDGDLVGVANWAPWHVEWDSYGQDGEHMITARAVDTNGFSDYESIFVTVKTLRPTVSMTWPSSTTTTSADSLTVTASAAMPDGSSSQIARVEFRTSNNYYYDYYGDSYYPDYGQTADRTAPYEMTWDISRLHGAHTVRALAVDSTGRGVLSEPITVTIERQAPTVTIRTPVAGSTIKGSAVPLGIDVAPIAAGGANVASVQYYLDHTWYGTHLGGSSTAPYDVVWDSSAFAGEHTVTAQVTDSVGRTTTLTSRVLIDNHPPSISLTSPTAYQPPRGVVPVRFQAAAHPNDPEPLTSVEVLIDGRSVGLATRVEGTDTYEFAWDPARWGYGYHSVQGVAKGASGETTRSTAHQFYLTPPQPSVSIDIPTQAPELRVGEPTELTIRVAPDAYTGSPVKSVTLSADYRYIVATPTSTKGVYTATWVPSSTGSRYLGATVVDEQGFSAYASRGVYVYGPPSAPSYVRGQARANGEALVAWDAPYDTGGSPILKYLVSDGTTEHEVAASERSFVFAGLTDFVDHRFTVRAVNTIGTSPASAPSNPVRPGSRLSVTFGPAPTTVDGSVSVTFGEAIRNVTQIRLLSTSGTTLTVPNAMTCRNAAGEERACLYEQDVHTVVLTPTRPLTPGQHYRMTVTGGPGGVTNVYGVQLDQPRYDLDFRAQTTVEEDSHVTRQIWRTVPWPDAYGSTFSDSRAGRARVTFTGSSITWHGVKGPSFGKGDLYVDGVLRGSINAYSATTGRMSFGISGLPYGSHVLEVVARGQRGSTAGTDTRFALDAVQVGSGPVVSSPPGTHTWARVSSTVASGGGYAVESLRGATFSLTFRGTFVDWRTLLGPDLGKATVHVDGVLRGTYDHYKPTREATTLRIGGLDDTSHLITITVLGQRHPAATDTKVAVDGFSLV